MSFIHSFIYLFLNRLSLALPNTYFWSAFAPELGLSLKGIPMDQAQATASKYHVDIDADKNSIRDERMKKEGEMSMSDQMLNGQLGGEEKEKEGGEEGDAMMLMANDGNLEDLVSLDVLQNVNNRGNNTLNESRMCKGLLFCESSFMFNRYTNQNFYSLSYDVETDLLVTSTIVRLL